MKKFVQIAKLALKTNWSILKLAPESEFDIQKYQLENILNEIILNQQNFENITKKKKLEHINERVRFIKKQIEDLKNEHIKKINNNKKYLFTELDNYAKEMKRTLNDFRFSKSEQSLKNLKDNIDKNEFSLEKLTASNYLYKNNISSYKSESNGLMKKLNGTFHFYPNLDTKIENDFIGSIKQFNFYKEYVDQAEKVYKEIKDKSLTSNKINKLNNSILTLEKEVELCPEQSRAYILVGEQFFY